MESPLFSIITITFNAAATLPATLKSVEQQSFADYEYLVVDGASTDFVGSHFGDERARPGVVRRYE